MEESDNKKPTWRDPIMIFSKVSIWIAVPIIIALFVGKSLDKHFDTGHWLFLACMGIGFAVSIVGIYKTSIREMKKMDNKKQDPKDVRRKKEINTVEEISDREI